MARLTACAGAALLILSFLPMRAEEPPAPRTEMVEETVNGVTVHDPYRWMEQPSPEFGAWARAESTHARTTLDAIPGRDELRARIEAVAA